MTVSINITGVQKAKSVLNGKKLILQNGISNGLKKSALFMQEKVKSSIAGREAEPTSVDTGRLLNSVDFNTSKDNATIFTDIPYGEFIENGTSKFQGRHHFRNSLNRNKQEIKTIVGRDIKLSVG